MGVDADGTFVDVGGGFFVVGGWGWWWTERRERRECGGGWEDVCVWRFGLRR